MCVSFMYNSMCVIQDEFVCMHKVSRADGGRKCYYHYDDTSTMHTALNHNFTVQQQFNYIYCRTSHRMVQR